ncbi:nucleotidyltransferase domain-containing protein, partial [Streptomyces sp. TRM76130]|nr:nucleotidyltransferase domain-containing protein [Streptomyces sp. TRM76130]
WLARRLETAAPGLGARLHHGLREVLSGRADALVTVVDEVLGQAGGRLWVGYRRTGTP